MKHRITCPECGAKPDWPDGKTEGFCPACRSLITSDARLINERAAKPPGKAIWMLLGGGVTALLFTVLALFAYPRVMPLISPPAETRYEGPGFDTPEDAAAAYLEALKALDLTAMISAYAIESYVDNFDSAAYVMQWGAYTRSFPIVNNAVLVHDINIENRESELVWGVHNNLLAMFFTWEGASLNNLNGATWLDEDNVGRFLREMQENDFADKLAGLEIKEFAKPEELSDRYNSEDIQQEIRNWRRLYGTEDYDEIAAFIEIGGEEYLFTATAARYGGRWYLLQPGGMISFLVGASGSYSAGIARLDGLDLSGYR